MKLLHLPIVALWEKAFRQVPAELEPIRIAGSINDDFPHDIARRWEPDRIRTDKGKAWITRQQRGGESFDLTLRGPVSGLTCTRTNPSAKGWCFFATL
jgi:hypothetical protein